MLSLRDVAYTYGKGSQAVPVLKKVNLTLKPTEMVALRGPSGAGKSTLLHLAGLLDRPSQGELWLGEQNCATLKEAERTRLRCHHLGFIYQFHHLLPELTALENVCVPLFIAGFAKKRARERALELLHAVQLDQRITHHPAALSGGEQQRVAIARALANRPQILLADEPTGNLDESTGQMVFGLLQTLARQGDLAVLMATHNPDLAKRMDRIVSLQEGQLIS